MKLEEFLAQMETERITTEVADAEERKQAQARIVGWLTDFGLTIQDGWQIEPWVGDTVRISHPQLKHNCDCWIDDNDRLVMRTVPGDGEPQPAFEAEHIVTAMRDGLYEINSVSKKVCNPICPLMSAGGEWERCKHNDCAWWVNGKSCCVVSTLWRDEP